MESSTFIPDDIYVHEDDTSDSEHILIESSMSTQIARYSLTTPMIENKIEHETVIFSVVISYKPLEFPCADYQVHTYFSQGKKKPVHLLDLDPFSKESLKT